MCSLTSVFTGGGANRYNPPRNQSLLCIKSCKILYSRFFSTQRTQFQKEEEVVKIKRDLQDTSTKYKMWAFVWILIQTGWL